MPKPLQSESANPKEALVLSIDLDLTYAHTDLSRPRDLGQVAAHHDFLHRADTPLTGWIDYPRTISPLLLQDIIDHAERVANACTSFVVVGIGGSFLGAKAGTELLISPFAERGDYGKPHILFAGHHLSTSHIHELFHFLEEEKDICICVISKSGTTLEPSVISSMLMKLMEKKYGPDYHHRIVAITDPHKGPLYQLAEAEGYKRYSIPEDIGGRYSVLTPVGLFPMAVAGLDVRAILAGARAARLQYMTKDLAQNDCYQYALYRHIQHEEGKIMEIFQVYEGRMRYFCEWLRQLFAESECKEGKGLFPTAMQMTSDLHSLGQFLQDGRQNFIETIISVDHIPETLTIPHGIGGSCDRLQCLNQVIQKAVCQAHQVNDTPNCLITVSELSPYTFGELVYFFQKACAMSALLLGVNPFDQPGVERYKHNIRVALAPTPDLSYLAKEATDH